MSTLAPPPRDGADPSRGPGAPPAAVRGSEHVALFEAVFGQSPIGAGVFDPDCRFVTANQALLDIVGLPLAQISGRRIEEVLGPLGDIIAANLRRAMATGRPLVNQEFTGATYAHGREPRAFMASYFRLDDAAGRPIGAASLVTDVTDARRVRDELAAANERLSLLSRVSGVLGSSLDVSATLAAFADLVVPAFADHCVIDLVTPIDPNDDEPFAVRRAVLVHAPGLAPEREAWAEPGNVVDYPAAHPAAVAMRTGRGVLEQAADDPGFQHLAPTPESAAYGHAVGVRSAMTVPLVARGEILGAVSFVTSASGRTFTAADIEIGEELGSRAAMALDNARMFGREQRIALTLQRSLLPDKLPSLPTLDTAAVYHAAARDGTVGGDWYDVIPLSCGRVGLVMGDVMGRGVHAAALMGQLRAAIRAYAAQDLAPGAVLGLLDDLVRELGDDTIVTCVYAVYDPVEEKMCVANAGHLPPLLVTRDGVQRLDVHGIVLGAGGGSYEQDEVDIAPDALVAFYTDGLVERRTEDLDARTDAFGAQLRAAAGSNETLANLLDRVVATAAEGAAEADDIAVMLMRPRPEGRPDVARLQVVAHATRVHELRRQAREVLAGWDVPADIADRVQLAVTELVTNVIRHADDDQAGVRLERHADRYVVAVIDRDPAPAVRARPRPDDEGGRGLQLIEGVADRWGSRQLPAGGKIVWVELLANR
jgi:PAS domain S-box-containing protein